MTLRQFLSVLAARWRRFLLAFGGVLLLAVLVLLLVSKKYTATATVVIDAKPDPLAPFAYAGSLAPSVMPTQVDIITSDRVARRVVRNLKLVENPAIREQWESSGKDSGDIETWLINYFLWRNLDVRPGRESNVITVSYEANDPQFAAVLANSFVQAYLDTVLELRVEPAKQYSSFFDARAKEARDALEQAQNRLSAFQRESGVVMTDERMDIETQRLNELSSQLVLLQSLSADSGSRAAQAATGSGDKLLEVNSNPVVAGLRADLSRLEARLQEFNAKLGERHPQVVELKANITETRNRMEAEVKRLSAGVGVTNSMTRQREGQVRADLEAQRAKVLRMKQVRDEGSLIIRDLENAQRTYDQILQRKSQTNLESQATASNIGLLSQAVPPVEASSPRVALTLIVALVLGVLAGLAAVLLAELVDRRLRNVEDVEEGLGLVFLGSLPAAAQPKRRRGLAALLPAR